MRKEHCSGPHGRSRLPHLTITLIYRDMVQELVIIQQRLKAPKGQYNNFGKYKYRSCEDILESVKPILTECGCSLVITDDVVQVGDRIYIKATATLTNSKGEQVQTTAMAREEETKKGMDASQVTGACSSYARKYALNGLFCIDDTKDADTTNTHGKESQTPVQNDDNLDLAFDEIKRAVTTRELSDIYNAYEGYRSNSKFMNALSTRRKQIEKR